MREHSFCEECKMGELMVDVKGGNLYVVCTFCGKRNSKCEKCQQEVVAKKSYIVFHHKIWHVACWQGG